MASKFICSKPNFKDANWIIMGAPMDFTSTRCPGSRFAPDEIRKQSYYLETFSAMLESSLEDINFYDLGDISLPFGNTQESLNILESVATKLLSLNKKIITIGGEHLISYPLIKAYSKFYKDLVILHLDAHADTREVYMGQKLSHGTVFRLCLSEIKTIKIYQLGIRSACKQEWDFIKQEPRVVTYPFNILSYIEEVIKEIDNNPVYLTIDIDVLDPGYAPGTGTPEPGGIDSYELFDSLYIMEKLNIKGIDIVEVCPMCDVNSITSLIAAKIIRESLILWGR